MGAATADQPMPQPGSGVSVQRMLVADLRWSSAPLVDDPGRFLVADDIEARAALGVQRYGTELYPHNGRDALVDAYQEALDLCMYLEQAMAEGRHVRAELVSALRLACALRRRIGAGS